MTSAHSKLGLLVLSIVSFVLAAGLLTPASGATGGIASQTSITTAAAFDVSPTLRALSKHPVQPSIEQLPNERGPVETNQVYTGDAVVQTSAGDGQIGSTIANFEGLSNVENPFQVQPPDPN